MKKIKLRHITSVPAPASDFDYKTNTPNPSPGILKINYKATCPPHMICTKYTGKKPLPDQQN